MTAPKRPLPRQFVEITERTTQRQFFLRPGKDTCDLVGYMYAKAVNDHGQTACAACCMSNHFHAAQLDNTAARSAFMQQFFSNVARKRNLQLDRRENLWRVGEPGDMVILGLSKIIEKTLYVIMQAVAAGCVKRASEWTGFKILPDDWGKLMTFLRPAKCGNGMPERVEFTPMPPPGFEHLPLETVRAFFNHLIRKEENRYARERKGPVLGIKYCEGISPYYTPKTNAPMRALNPRFSSNDRSLIARALQMQKRFRAEHRQKLNELRDGNRNAVFPAGTLQMLLRGGVSVAACRPDDPHLVPARWTEHTHKQWDDWLAACAA